MDLNVRKEVAALERLTTNELQARYAEVFGEATRVRHKQYLVKRIAWRIQANAEGGLSERALRRAAELANEADIRSTAPRAKPVSAGAATRTVKAPLPVAGDRRLPMPGVILSRVHRGRTVQVMVLADGFEYEGRVYKSLSAIAREVTGTQWNGYLFFGLVKGGGR